MYIRHNSNEWVNHKKEVIRPSFEKIKLEIFSFEHKLTQRFHPTKNNIRGSNLKKVNHRSLKCLESEDNATSFTMEFDFNIKEVGEYRIDILYENKNAKDYIGEYDLTLKSEKSSKLYSNTANVMAYAQQLQKLNAKVKKVKEDLTKAKAEYKTENEKKDKDKDKNKIETKKKVVAKYESELSKLNKKVTRYETKLEKTHKMAGTPLSFEGELNITKRKTLFHDLQRLGKYRLSLELPVNCYFIGLLVRKIKYYSGDNLDSVGTNLMFTDATITKSGEVKPAEASFELGFNDEFLCPLTYTGMYFNYGDEVNIYVKENSLESNTKMVRRFGGYLSTIQKSADKKTVTFSCADRLIDGESKFILDALLIQKGTTSKSEMEYNKPINFNNYGQALKYLCDIHELTLKSNIKKNYLVAGEKYSTGLALKFGKKKDIKDPKKVKAKNSTVKFHNKFITVRNGKSGLKEQSIMLYNAKEYAKTPRPLKKVNSKGETTVCHLSFHMTYGLGDPAKSSSTSSTDQTSNADGSSGNYGKCGQSADKKTVMSIAKPSSGRNEGLSESQWYKVVFKNWCPHCKKSNLVYDSGTSKTDCVTCAHYTGSKRTWGDISEGEITCNTEDCCSDFCGATGWEKDGGFSSRLVTVVKPVKSSQAERDKLLDGQMSGAGAVKVSADNIFKEITKEAFKYRYYMGGSGQTWAEMKKIGYGDCFGFSDLIFKMMSKFGVKCKIVEYAATGGASNHHSVMYMNKKGNWVDFPYRELGWNTRYNNQLNNTSGSANGQIIAINNSGKSIDQANGTISSTSTTTTKVTTTVGYAKDNPYQAYIELVYSTENKWKSKKKKININFTQKAGTDEDISGLPSYWINNAQRQVSVDLKGWFEDNEPKKSIYLHSIRFVTPIMKSSDNSASSSNKKEWYSFDKQTKDYASCKLDLYQIIFDDKLIINPADLQSCGKTVNAVMEEIVEASGYRVHINYAKHRCDDKIIFSVDDQTKPLFTAQEGDDNNILEWSNISCSPVTVVRNTSVCVYKDAKGKYQYVDTRNINSMLEYGEQTTLQTNSEVSGSKEAYFLARNSKEFNPEFDYTYTIVIPYAPNLQLKDIVEVIANNKFLNDIKPIESLQIKYDNNTKPTIQTTLGLGEIEPYLRIKQDMQKLRTANKKKSTYFDTTASPVDNEEIYAWDQ